MTNEKKEKIYLANRNFLINHGYKAEDDLFHHGLLVYYVRMPDESFKAYGIYSDNIESRNIPKKNFPSNIRHCNLQLYNIQKGEFYINDITRNVTSLGVSNNLLILAFNGKSLEKITFGNIYENNELIDIYTVAFKQSYINNTSKKNTKLVIYKNDTIIFCKDNVIDFNYINKKILFTTFFDNKYHIYYFNITNNIDTYLGAVDDYRKILNNNFFANQKENNLFYKKCDFNIIDSDGYVNFYFSYNESKEFFVLIDYIKNADKIEIIDSIFKNDISVNYKVSYLKTRTEDIEFLIFLILYKGKMNLEIYGYSLDTLIKYSLVYDDVKDIITKVNENFTDIFKTIKNLMNQTNNLTGMELVYYLLSYYGDILTRVSSKRQEYYKKYLKKKNDETAINYLKKYNNKYNGIYNKLMKEGAIKTKWNSEAKLFRLVSTYFIDSIYQYKDEWLGLQSLDIFIPSLKIAIEYQGLQHYESVDFFGGEYAFKKIQERDLRKQKLCNDNQVKIIYWNYNEEINVENLKKKFKSINTIIQDIQIKNNINDSINALNCLNYKHIFLSKHKIDYNNKLINNYRTNSIHKKGIFNKLKILFKLLNINN